MHDLNKIISDPRFSEIKEVRQRRDKTDERVGFCCHFDGREFKAHSIEALAYVVSDYMCDSAE